MRPVNGASDLTSSLLSLMGIKTGEANACSRCWSFSYE
ncbi:AgrD family cyclic lactone autoinducer peptide [Cohnella cholangitidis]|uniref:Cyclic lactone autoinducer peptide n=1 Tax=Cohnella cholangitidis TaxID=2598458 RepID=A0A7G5BTX7_9BACL|nr:cyclic lactone autoinducer peptide [Cohnella cholangitidis]